jgi:GDP-L-fucose synthase
MSAFWKQRKVVVVGGSGFIGSHLVELLLGAGARVRFTASSPETGWRFLAHVKNDLECVVGDVRDDRQARNAVRGQEIVMNLAARVGGVAFNKAHPASLFQSNLRAFMAVIEAARVEGAERFLVTSSACVYPSDAGVPTAEHEGFAGRPEKTNEGYGWAKRMEEYLGSAYASEYGMDVRIARPYNAYGPRDNFDVASSHVIPALIRRAVAGENPFVVWGHPSVTRSFIYVTDFARGLMLTAERSPQIDAINIGSREETTIGDLANMIVAAAGTRAAVQFDSSQPTGQMRRSCDTSLAERLLNFRAEVPIAEGLTRTVAWYVEHGRTIA